MKINKILSITFTILMLLFITACGNQNSTGTSNKETISETAAASESIKTDTKAENGSNNEDETTSREPKALIAYFSLPGNRRRFRRGFHHYSRW